MPHQCLKCSKMYPDDSDVILKGCFNCGKKLFFFIKNLPKDKTQIDISKEEKNEIEKKVLNMIDFKEKLDAPIVLDLENINVKKDGKYEIDINSLIKEETPVFKIRKGTYVIDLNSIVKKNN